MKGGKRPKYTQKAVSGKAGRKTNAGAKKRSEAGRRSMDWNCHDSLGKKPKGGREC